METKDIMEEIKGCRNFKDIEILMHKKLPGWCLGFMDKFSDDYPEFTKNWHKTCEKVGIKPAQIMIVKKLDITKKNSAHTFFADCFTGAGFCVRRNIEFTSCPACSSAIPTKNLYNIIKENNVNIPRKWSSYCVNCK